MERTPRTAVTLPFTKQTRRPSKMRFRDRMRRFRERAPQPSSLIPNIVTIGALCLGLWGLKLAYEGRWEWAVGTVVLASFLDAMDGRLARFLNASSQFGASLDMLSDFANFGIVPAWMMYFFIFHSYGGVGWGACLFFMMCCALRLARFSTGAFDTKAFFCGLPSPAAGLIALAPLMITLEWPEARAYVGYGSFVSLCGSALLMISRVPTPALKNLSLRPGWMMPILAGVGLFFANLIQFPWRTLLALETVYLLSLIPFAFYQLRSQRSFSKKNENKSPHGPTRP